MPRSAGWYPHPAGTGWRYWDGHQWTWRTSLDDPASRAADREAAARAFVHDACAAGLIPDEDEHRLQVWAHEWAGRYAAAWSAPVRQPAAVPESRSDAPLAPPSGPTPTETRRPLPAPVSPAAVPAPARAARPRPVLIEPSPAVQPPVPPTRSWLDRAQGALVSDLSVHGLAYLGVLLLFAGVVGFVVFAFGDVSRAWRPLAEILVPVSLFAAAWVLARRGSHVVGRALAFAGGAVLPVVAVATLVDGVSFPPDLHGTTLVLTAASIPLAIAVAYAWIGTRWPTSPLRYLAAPALWLAVALAALLPRAGDFGGWVGERIARPAGSGQVAAVLVAVAAVAVLARLRPHHPLSRPSLVSSAAGLVVVLLLGGMTGARDAWPIGPVLVAAAAVVVALEGLTPLLPAWLVGLGQPLALLAPLAVPGTIEQRGWVAASMTAAALALLEWQARARPEPLPVASAGGAAAVALAVALVDPWAGLAALTVALAWSAARSIRPLASVPALVCTAALAILPWVIVGDLYRVADPVAVTAVAAATVLAVAVALRFVPAASGSWWRWWVIGAAGATAYAAGAVASDVGPDLWLAACAAAAACAVGLTTVPVPVRTWLTTAGLYVAGGLVLATLDAGPGAVALVLAVVGLVLTEAAWVDAPVAHHLTDIGLLSGGAAIVVATRPGDPFIDLALALAVAGWISCAVAAELGRWAIDRSLGLVDAELTRQDLTLVADALALAGVPALALVVLHGTGLLDTSTAPAGLALGAAGLAYAALTRPLHGRHRLAVLIAAFGIVGCTLAVPLAWFAAAAALATAVALTAWPLVTHRSVRPPAATWLAWAATAPAVLAAARLAGVPDDRLAPVLLSWGSVAAIGALLADRVLNGARTEPGWVRERRLLPPAWLGAVAAAGALGGVVVDPAWAWWWLGMAGVLTAAAVLTRTGGVTAAAWVVGLAGLVGLLPDAVVDRPPSWVAAGAAVLAVSAALGPLHDDDQPWWAAWDLPAFVVANALVLAGVVQVGTTHEIVVTWAPAGGLALVVAWWKRNVAWAGAGMVLLVGAGVAAGPGWRTASFAALSLAASAVANRFAEPRRSLLRFVSATAAGATWWSLVAWRAWPATTWVTATALASGAVAVALAASVRWLHVRATTAAPWLLLPAAGFVAAAAGIGVADRLVAGLALAGGVGLLALAAGMTARPLDTDALRPAASAVGLVALGIVAWATAATPVQVVLVALTVSLGAALTGLALAARRRASPWLLPVDIVAIASAAAAIAAGFLALPERGPLTAALAAAGGVAAMVAAGRRRDDVALAVPVLEVAAWLVWTTAALHGEPAWLLLPVGLGLLVEAALLRRLDARGADTFGIAQWTELTGMAFVVGPALVETVTQSLAWALLAGSLGLGLAAWGVLTHCRRRLAVGAGAVVLAVALLLLVPLADLLPAAGTGALFLAIAAVGLAAIALATFLESGRARLGHAVDHLRDLTRGWS